MLSRIIKFSIHNKIIVLLFTGLVVGFGLFALTRISIGAVPDVTNNQVQVITTSRNLSTQEMEQFITYPIELEMANLPGVVEIRSVSKFGLSVVTIVFKDEMGTYLPRQLITEKIESASEKIPEGFGTPELGPITTGLGEIYQYVLDVEEGYEDQYSVTDLRTIQDWIVKRQLSGIDGVVEVNTWGGYLKQYEVALNTGKLNAMNVTAREVFSSLEKNNSIAGGGYIEKTNQAYFIRGEGLVGSLSDIEQIVVKVSDGIPIYIKDVASVGFGSATRFGAITGNGEGEKVLGQVMMLKNANSKRVIDAVKERVDIISQSLPEGVYINPFLDRSQLIAKTTKTVTENLLLGCIIVIFVVVVLLGNMRSGLIVASVIPLSLLFAISLMYLSGVDANLMSLGAIDFGIIIDGAVIIVEFIAFRITANSRELEAVEKNERQGLRDRITLEGATKMMNSAIFGQLIILIVFIPILSLSGIEGKMFKPMALTFSFALIGAIILCFTYVPVVTSIFAKPTLPSKRNFSVRMMGWIHSRYEPVIEWALHRSRVVLIIAISLLALSGFLFSNLGAEFVPTLDEGDFVIQPVLKTGTSLEKTIATTTRIEQVLIDKFPEVDQIITRIGAAEVPTDPMSMEETDVIIILKPKKEWKSARSKDELANKFKEALGIFPGMEVEFTQPIEMRFNELITGVRADIAIKVFGEDLDVLSDIGNEIRTLIQDVKGAADISVEKVAGLPQMNVKYDRGRIARYGLNVEDLNQILTMGFSGRTVGQVYEGERRFDMVVRLDKEHRSDIRDIQDLYIDVPTGGKVPLRELAEITYQKGAAKISRDDTRRRIVVGINVRDRDLQSVVKDIQELIGSNIALPAGYTIAYGGQFENLQQAKSRLKFAVPIALLLIFILLYFAFGSLREALLIFTAIPLAAIGGVLLLWLRDMPFSISAGIGFIALFGIAVLNGIVLIEHFKELKQKSFESMESLVKQGTKDRLRAVLLTASAAAMGFLPMAISSGVGAEVQRPLATVVIGGLVTATLLTLVVLPVLYVIVNRPKGFRLIFKKSSGSKIFFILAVSMSAIPLQGQEHANNLKDLVKIAVENNAGLKATRLNEERSATLVSSAFDFEKTRVYYHYDRNNLTINREPLRVVGIQQNFLFPTVYFAEKKRNNLLKERSGSTYDIDQKTIERRVTANYYTYQNTTQRELIIKRLDSLYRNFAQNARRRFELGETNYLEKITAESKQRQSEIRLKHAAKETKIAYNNLLMVLQVDSAFSISPVSPEKIPLKPFAATPLPELEWYELGVSLMKAEHRLSRQQLMPDISLNYFQGTAPSLEGTIDGYQLGLNIPLLFTGKSSRIKAARIGKEMAELEYQDYEIMLKTKRDNLMEQYTTQAKALEYYETEGTELSEQILKTASLGYKHGEIDFFQYLISIENALDLRLGYLEALNDYNQTVIDLNFISL